MTTILFVIYFAIGAYMVSTIIPNMIMLLRIQPYKDMFTDMSDQEISQSVPSGTAFIILKVLTFVFWPFYIMAVFILGRGKFRFRIKK